MGRDGVGGPRGRSPPDLVRLQFSPVDSEIRACLPAPSGKPSGATTFNAELAELADREGLLCAFCRFCVVRRVGRDGQTGDGRGIEFATVLANRGTIHRVDPPRPPFLPRGTKSMRKKLIIFTGVTIIGIVAAIGIAVSLLVNIDRFRPQLAQAMSAALGRDVGMGRISLSLLSGSAVVEDLSIADDPAFGRTPFLTAKAVRVGIAWLPLVTSKHLRVESLRLQEPQLTLRRSAAGAWNFSTLAASSSATAAGPQSSSSSSLTLSIDRLSITKGQVVVETAAARARRAVYQDLAVDVHDISATSRFQFAIGLATPAGGTLDANGSAGPIGATGLGSTPFEAVIDATHVDIARSGFLDPGAGLAGIIDLHLRTASNGARISASGTLRGDKLQLVPGASPASQPIDVAYASGTTCRSKRESSTRATCVSATRPRACSAASARAQQHRSFN